MSAPTANGSVLSRLTFLIHPYCYAASLGVPDTWEAQRWRRYHEREAAVAEGWHVDLHGAARRAAIDPETSR